MVVCCVNLLLICMGCWWCDVLVFDMCYMKWVVLEMGCLFLLLE